MLNKFMSASFCFALFLCSVECKAANGTSHQYNQEPKLVVPQTPAGVRMKTISQNKKTVEVSFVAEVDYKITGIVFSFLDEEDFLLTSRSFRNVWVLGSDLFTSEEINGKQLIRGQLTIDSHIWNQCVRIGMARYVN